MTYSDCFTNEQLHHALAKAVAERDEAREDAERYRLKTLSQDAEIAKLKASSNENYLCKETLDQE